MSDKTMKNLTATPGQTVGPFFHDALPYERSEELVPAGMAGAIRLHGVVRDGAGEPIPDALVELWQADADGNIPQVEGSLRRDGFTFTGYGRSATDANGHYSFSTVAPGATETGKPAYFLLTVFARGLLNRLFTRAYLPVEGGQPRDALLDSLEARERKALLAEADGSGYRFDICLHGEDETPFLAYPNSPDVAVGDAGLTHD